MKEPVQLRSGSGGDVTSVGSSEAPTRGVARRALKRAVLLSTLIARRRPGDLVILLYHRIGGDGSRPNIPAGAFESQLGSLLRHDRIPSLDDALADRRGGVVISIDDGYRDLYDHALPLLARYQVPAVLYLATGLVADGEPVGIDRKEALSWSQLREAVATGLVTVGAHTHSHANMAHLPESAVQEELTRSKGLIEDNLGVACRHFAYPYGDVSPAAERAVRGIFDSAALASGTNRAGRIDRYRLGRTHVDRGDDWLSFRAKSIGRPLTESWMYRAFSARPFYRGKNDGYTSSTHRDSR
jgi:peptidoglycan/xylan/chitin deacetylase (PgdA/CDA1 family)